MAPRQLPPLADARFPRLRLLAVPGRCLRLIFTVEGPSRQVLLALDGNRSGDRQVKHLGLAQWRLDDWRRRGTEMQRSQSLGGLGD